MHPFLNLFRLCLTLSIFMLPVLVLSQTYPVYAPYENFDDTVKKVVLNQTIDSLQTIEKSIDTLPFSIRLVHLGQYMQSVQLIFEFTNMHPEMVNHFWVHVSLLDQNKYFLYREQPALFTNIRKGKSQRIELLCESVGLEEVGYIVIHPQLLEIDRNEVSFDVSNIKLIMQEDTGVKMIFNSYSP